MGRRRSSSPRSRRRAGRSSHRRGARTSILILLGLVVLGVILILITSGLAERGVQKVLLPLRHEDVIRQQAKEKEVPAALIAAVIYAESGFVDQTSHADARGLMQITPQTAREIEKLSGGNTFELKDLRDPDLNIRYGTFYLGYLLERFDGDLVAALAAYNAGPSIAEEWLGRNGRARAPLLTINDLVDLDGRDYSETRAYVKKVLEKQREYRHKYPVELGY